MRLRWWVFGALLLPCAGAPAQTADIVFVNGTIWTVDPLQPQAEAVAVRDGIILSVGTTQQLRKHIGLQTNVVDLHGRLMVPGFIDNHVHFMSGSLRLDAVDLRDARTEEEFAARIAERATAAPDRWITGGEWDHDRWPGGALPSRELVDAGTGETPVFVTSRDGHMGLANSEVLRRANITRDTPDPPGGVIVRHPVTGEPTGVLQDAAMELVRPLIPAPTSDEMRTAAERGLAEARRMGVTTLHDVASEEDVAVYRTLQEEGRLTARFHCRLPLGDREDAAKHEEGDTWVRTGSLRESADGSLGSSTALFCAPYLSDPGTCGVASDVLIDGRLPRWATAADRAGFQLSIHAVGDSANRLVLDMFERIAQLNPPRDRRFRIEHAQYLRTADLPRFALLGVIASMQPYPGIDDGRWAEERIGRERCRTACAFGSLLAHNALVSFGSDWPAAPLNPLLGIFAAVTRRTIDGKNPGGWFPDERISVSEALRAYTMTNAFAVFEETWKGSITQGKAADLVVLAENILTIDPVRIGGVAVDLTVVGGKVVYQRSE
jgi:predicted amidohydrolase YtcJ